MSKGISSVFFRELSERFYKENDLSDITYALCKTDSDFSLFFLRFLFPNESNITGLGNWQREVQGKYSDENGGSRIDFLYEEFGIESKFLIENKINDTDTHEEKYPVAFPKHEGYKTALIANYYYKQENSFYDHCETWKSFLSKLKESKLAKDLKNDEKKNLICGYIEYLSIIIRNMEAERMDFSSIDSIRSLFVIIKEYAEKAELKGYPGTGYYYQSKDNWLGKYYYDDKNIYYYFCLEFGEESRFCMYIKPSWKNDHLFNERVNKAIKNKEITTIDKCFSYEDNEWGLGVSLNKKQWEDYFLNNQTELAVQREVLESFFNEVVETCRDCLA